MEGLQEIDVSTDRNGGLQEIDVSTDHSGMVNVRTLSLKTTYCSSMQLTLS